MVKRLVLLAAVATLALACGAAPGQGGAPTPSPSENPMHFDVTATEKDRAVTMHVGQRLEVVLHGNDTFRYEQVRSTDQNILEPTVDPAATAIRGVTLAAFRAKAAGQAEVTAVGTPVCPSGQACPMYVMLYQLAVTVSP
jgi:hypothetical protein